MFDKLNRLWNLDVKANYTPQYCEINGREFRRADKDAMLEDLTKIKGMGEYQRKMMLMEARREGEQVEIDDDNNGGSFSADD